MSALNEHRAQIVAGLKTILPTFDIQPFAGRFKNEDDLKAFSVKAPAMRVGVIGINRVEGLGDSRIILYARMAAVLATKPVAGVRDQAMLGAVEKLVAAAYAAQFQAQPLSAIAPSDIQAEEIDDGAGTTGIVMWAVLWTAPVALEEPVEAAPPWF